MAPHAMEETGFSPNQLMLGRVDLMVGIVEAINICMDLANELGSKQKLSLKCVNW